MMANVGQGRGWVGAVCRRAGHGFRKDVEREIQLLAGLGVEGDAHFGATVKHRSRVAEDPSQPNLRQVHLIPGEVLDALNLAGFAVSAGNLGENVTTRGVDLLALPQNTELRLGGEVSLQLTGLRNPCHQLDRFRDGLMAALLDRDADGSVIRKAGVMAIVLKGGTVRTGDTIEVQLPPEPHVPLAPV